MSQEVKKRCSKCGEWKEVGEFSLGNWYCKLCRRNIYASSPHVRDMAKLRSKEARKGADKYLLNKAQRKRRRRARSMLFDGYIKFLLKDYGALSPTPKQIEETRHRVMAYRKFKELRGELKNVGMDGHL